MGEAVFPPCYLTWGQTIVEVVKIMVTSFKRSHEPTATLSAPNPASGHHWPMPALETPGHSWASLSQSLVGSLLLSPGSQWKHKVLLVLSKSLFHLSCVSSGSSMVDLMVTSFRRAYSIPRSTAPRAPVPGAVHCWPIPLQETLKHSSVSVSVGLWVLVHTRFVWALWASLTDMGFDSKHDFAPHIILLVFFLCPWTQIKILKGEEA